MKIKIYFILLLNFIFNINHTHYQDIFVNGKILENGYGQNCTERYKLIKNILNRKYHRPITVLDIGAAQGYFSFRIANDFKSTCVMLDPDSYLTKLCRLNTNLNNIIHLQKKIDVNELELLADCEHFDFIMAFNVIHHFKADWKKAIDHICNLGETILIENPPIHPKNTLNSQNLEAIQNYILKKGGQLIAQFPRWTDPDLLSNIYLIEKTKNTLNKVFWLKPKSSKKNYFIESTKTQKKLTKLIEGTKIVSAWRKGINLLTFKMLNGKYPLIQTLEKEIPKLKNYPNFNDCLFHNLVIQGNNIVPIDLVDPRRYKTGWKFNNASYALILKILRARDPATIKMLYGNNGILPLNFQKFK